MDAPTPARTWTHPGRGGVRGSDVAVLSFTSGTTGASKAIVLTHRNLVSNALAGTEHMDITSEDRLLSILPLNHLFEQTAGLLIPLIAGARLPLVRVYAWEAPQARLASLANNQQEHWLKTGKALLRQNHLRGDLRIGLVRAMAHEGPTDENRQLFGLLFQHTNAMDASDIRTLDATRDAVDAEDRPETLAGVADPSAAIPRLCRGGDAIPPAGPAMPGESSRKGRPFRSGLFVSRCAGRCLAPWRRCLAPWRRCLAPLRLFEKVPDTFPTRRGALGHGPSATFTLTPALSHRGRGGSVIPRTARLTATGDAGASPRRPGPRGPAWPVPASGRASRRPSRRPGRRPGRRSASRPRAPGTCCQSGCSR